MNGYITHASTGTKRHPVYCGGLLMMPHEAGLRFDKGHVFCTVCSVRGKRKAEPVTVDPSVYADVEACCPIPTPPSDEMIVSVAQLDKSDRRCFHAVATGAIAEAVFKTKASLKRLHDMGLVDGWKDPSAAKLTPLGEEFAASNALGEGIGGQVQVPMFVEPAARRPEPQVILAEPAPVAPTVEARSPLKWVGSKGKLLGDIVPALPATFGRLLVPFVGGGALPFRLGARGAYLSDANPHLVNVYLVIRDRVEDLILALQDHKNERDYYEALKGSFNDGYGDEVWRAGAFIYMNKVGFNGLCRYNQSGKFNVPFGDMPNAKICDAENLRACSVVLQGAVIEVADFRAVEALAKPGDLCYLDCPYIPESKTAAFTGYWGKWTDQDHEDVPSLFRRLAARGVHVLASNSETPRARELYAGFEIRTLTRANSVNSKASARGGKPEILVLGGTWTPRGAS